MGVSQYVFRFPEQRSPMAIGLMSVPSESFLHFAIVVCEQTECIRRVEEAMETSSLAHFLPQIGSCFHRAHVQARTVSEINIGWSIQTVRSHTQCAWVLSNGADTV